MVSGEPSAPTEVDDAEIDAVLHACRSLVAIAAWSADVVANEVDLMQLRVLVLIATRGSASLKAVVETTSIHPSRASRTCDRLVSKGLIARSADPTDRRSLRMTLTPAGERIVRRVRQARRSAIAPVLSAMSPGARADLLRALEDFATASDGVPDGDLSALAWQG